MIRQEGLSLKTDGDPKARFRILAILTRLRRLCCASELVATGRNPGSSKIDALMEPAEELKESGHKALVFSQFTDVLAIVEKRMKEAGHSYLYLDGSTPPSPSRGAGEELPIRQGRLLPHLPESRRRGPYPDRGGLRHSAGPLVEPGGG